MREDEKDYAVAFFTPIDTDGITFVCRPPSMPSKPKELENPLSSKFGSHVECIAVFNDVFIPWESIFMAGEYEFAGPMATTFSSIHTPSKGGCGAGAMDTAIGALALIADYNGVEHASHIRDYLTEMIMAAETVYSCGIAAAAEGARHDSGVHISKGLPAHSGKVYYAKKVVEERFFMQDAAGGLVVTMASEEDYRNPETSKYLEKYYRGREGVPTEHRVRAFKLIEDLIASDYAGYYQAMSISGGVNPQSHKQMIFLDYDFEPLKRRARRAAGID